MLLTSMNHLSRESVNLFRLIDRLEKNPNLEIVKRSRMNHNYSELNGSRDRGHHYQCGPAKTDDDTFDEEKFDHTRYWELKSLETTIRHARSILDTINSNPTTVQSIRQIQDPIELRNKLEKIEDRIDVALKNCPPPRIVGGSPPSSQLVHQIKAPELPPIPMDEAKEVRVEESTSVELEEAVDKSPAEHKPGRGDRGTDRGQEPTERVDKHSSNMNNNQEEMTEELSQMASQLKKNVHHFNKLLAEDQAILSINQTKLELNSNLMGKEGGRLTQVSLKNRSMTWFTIAAVLVVAISWILMFIIIRLT